jgi:hypothetical protein
MAPRHAAPLERKRPLDMPGVDNQDKRMEYDTIYSANAMSCRFYAGAHTAPSPAEEPKEICGNMEGENF